MKKSTAYILRDLIVNAGNPRFILQDRRSYKLQVRALVTFSGAVAGLSMLLIGSMIPSAFLIPKADHILRTFPLASSWQVPSLLLCAMVCGSRSALIAIVSYLTIGLLYLPIFHGGGSIGYLLTPDIGYLLGFIPAAWICGKDRTNHPPYTFLSETYTALTGMISIHIFGIISLTIGAAIGLWSNELLTLLVVNSFAPFAAQVTLCPAIAIIALLMRRILLIK